MGAERKVPGATARLHGEKPQDKDEASVELMRERYRFLVQHLGAEIRQLLHSLPEFADLPRSSERSWPEALAGVERELAELVRTEAEPMSLEAVVALLNCKDKAVCLLCNALLFQKALLNWELMRQGPPEETGAGVAGDSGALLEFTEQIEKHLAKHGSLPEKHRLSELPTASAPGPFTYDKTKAAGSPVGAGNVGAQAASESELQGCVIATLRETQSLDKAIRWAKFGKKVTIPDKNRPAGKAIGSEAIRKEITWWCDRVMRLEHELQARKAQLHTPWEVQVEFYKQRCQEKDHQNLTLRADMQKLEQDGNNFKKEFANLRREMSELAEKNQKMASESLPVLDRIDLQLDKSGERVDQLTADAEMLSSMFRLQVEENQKLIAERDRLSRELAKVRKQLKSERENNTYKEDELQKKDKLHRLTAEAREAAQKDYHEQKDKIKQVEAKVQAQEERWQKKLAELEDRDGEVRRLGEALRLAQEKIDRLEQQKKHCMQEYKAVTGEPYNMLLEQFKVA